MPDPDISSQGPLLTMYNSVFFKHAYLFISHSLLQICPLLAQSTSKSAGQSEGHTHLPFSHVDPNGQRIFVHLSEKTKQKILFRIDIYNKIPTFNRTAPILECIFKFLSRIPHRNHHSSSYFYVRRLEQKPSHKGITMREESSIAAHVN